MTEQGTCDRAYRYPVRISNGSVGYAGEASFNVSGRVGANGAVTVTVSRGSQSATRLRPHVRDRRLAAAGRTAPANAPAPGPPSAVRKKSVSIHTSLHCDLSPTSRLEPGACTGLFFFVERDAAAQDQNAPGNTPPSISRFCPVM